MFDRGHNGGLASRLVLFLAKHTYVPEQLLENGSSYIRDSSEDGNLEAELIDCQKVSVIHFLEFFWQKLHWRYYKSSIRACVHKLLALGANNKGTNVPKRF
jgi:hypothetical protein